MYWAIESDGSAAAVFGFESTADRDAWVAAGPDRDGTPLGRVADPGSMSRRAVSSDEWYARSSRAHGGHWRSGPGWRGFWYEGRRDGRPAD